MKIILEKLFTLSNDKKIFHYSDETMNSNMLYISTLQLAPFCKNIVLMQYDQILHPAQKNVDTVQLGLLCF